MANTISQKKTKDSKNKPISVKLPPRDKIFGIESEIFFCKVEDGNKTEEGEES